MFLWSSISNCLCHKFIYFVMFGCLCFFPITEQRMQQTYANVGNTARIKCYDNQWIAGDDDFFISVNFISNKQEADTSFDAKYLPSESRKTVVDSFPSSGDDVNFYIQDNVGYLQIDRISLQNEGTYVCRGVSFDASRDLQWTTYLTVYVPPTLNVVKLIDPISALSDNLLDVARCDAVGGKPAATVEWESPRYHQILQVKRTTNDSTGMQSVSSTLQFAPTRFYDKEQFECKITHPGFNQTYVRVFTANVTYSPSSIQIYADKDNKYLTCYAEGNPTVKYRWILPGDGRKDGPTVDLLNPGDPNHMNDTYQCVAENSLGLKSLNISMYEATLVVTMAKQSHVGTIVGIVVGVLALIGVVIGLVYFFYFRKFRRTDKGPYHQRATLVRQTTDKPSIQHANDTLNKNRPPSPPHPPPDHDDDDHSSSSGTEEEEGNHDVDIETKVPQYNPKDDGITSRSSVNFRARRQRPSSSPSSRRSRAESQMQKQANDSPPPHPNSRYDVPPGDEGVGYPYEHEGYMRPSQQYNNDTYPYHHPRYAGDYHDEQTAGLTDPRHYEPKYSDIDHSGYQKGSYRPPPREEPVEYAQIMSQNQGTHIV